MVRRAHKASKHEKQGSKLHEVKEINNNYTEQLQSRKVNILIHSCSHSHFSLSQIFTSVCHSLLLVSYGTGGGAGLEDTNKHIQSQIN